MKTYILSPAVGLLFGVIYSLINVRSPAPPAIALIGLLGILAGEQAVPLVGQTFSAGGTATSATIRQSVDHVFGLLPGRGHGGADHQAAGDQT